MRAVVVGVLCAAWECSGVSMRCRCRLQVVPDCVCATWTSFPAGDVPLWVVDALDAAGIPVSTTLKREADEPSSSS